MDDRKSPGVGFWFCVAGTVLGLYIAAYGLMRWQGVLPFGTNRGVYHDEYPIEYANDGTAAWREVLGPPAEKLFRPLQDIERQMRARE